MFRVFLQFQAQHNVYPQYVVMVMLVNDMLCNVVLVEARVVEAADLQLVSLEIGNDWRFLGRQLGCSDAVTLNAHTLCALRSLRAHGLREKGIKEVFRSVVLTWLLYSSPSWWSFAGSKKLQIIDGFHDAAPRPISDLLIYLPSY